MAILSKVISKSDVKILIVGAGPSGLSMAIFLSDLGYTPTIIDKKNHISPHSKALAVNPRTLEIFEKSGITSRFLHNGRKMHAINLWKGGSHLFRNAFIGSHDKYPFMLIQPQKESEEILRNELSLRNIEVHYGTKLESYNEQSENGYTVTTQPALKENNSYDFIVGADGGHSQVRDQMGVTYKGFRYDEEWEIWDVEIITELEPNEGHIRLFSEGGMIMIRLKEDIWRIAGSMTDLLNYLPKSTKVGKVQWESVFRIHHKIAQTLTKDKAVLIGDAAHLHSPAGARGMNLGIEDAYMASELINTNQLDTYNQIRRPYLEKTVEKINDLTMNMAGDSWTGKIFRNYSGLIKYIFPLVMPKAQKFIMGLNK